MFRGSIKGLSRKNELMRIIAYSLICLMIASCNSDKNAAWEGNKEKEKVDSSYSIEPNHLAVKTEKELTDAKGVIGLFIVPEMLMVTKLDSAPVSKVPAGMAKGFETIVEDMKLMKVNRYGSAGAIYYNNDTNNFVFECLVPIEKMPKIQPKKSQVVILEEDKMLVYNYYGPYEYLNNAYEEIREYCRKNKLEQSGPMREFYITDETMVKDPSQWLTRIMLPVK